MGLASTQDRFGVPPRARRWQWPRLVAALVLISLLVVAFLLWGPIGLGSGPLTVNTPSGGQILGPRDQAWGLLVGMQAVTPGRSLTR